MNVKNKVLKKELKRMSASLIQSENPKKRVPNLTQCMYCKVDAGKNFILVYKRNEELKGKVCKNCFAEFENIKRLNV